MARSIPTDNATHRIGILLERKQMHLHRSLPGLHQFSLDHPEVQFISIHRESELPRMLKEGELDALLGHLDIPEQDMLEAWGGPAVSILNTPLSIPMVIHDHRAIGRLAGEFFLERGYTSIAYCGNVVFHWSPHRLAGFREWLAENGRDCLVFNGHPQIDHAYDNHEAYIGGIAAWLTDAPRPLGLFCGSDEIGGAVLEACRRIGHRVPEDVSILAVSAEEWLSRFCDPPLSTINTDLPGVGYLAAEWLMQIINGEAQMAQEVRVVPPQGLTERESTDAFPHEDRLVARAMRFASDHLSEAIGVDDLAVHVSLSRSSLHRRFVHATGLPPGRVLKRMRIDRARRELTETDTSLLHIALNCGFGGAAQFSREFHKATGMPPTEYRRRFGRK
ncbi:MAG: substrate-binding domain-containing protein [Planctomycetota bacterium]